MYRTTTALSSFYLCAISSVYENGMDWPRKDFSLSEVSALQSCRGKRHERQIDLCVVTEHVQINRFMPFQCQNTGKNLACVPNVKSSAPRNLVTHCFDELELEFLGASFQNPPDPQRVLLVIDRHSRFRHSRHTCLNCW